MEDKLDQNQIADLVRLATNDVFSTMLGLELKPLESFSVAEPELPPAGILSLIGFAGSWVGTGSMSCSTALACQLADALFMSPHSAVEEEVMDAVAEMTNMILGYVKTELEEILGPMMLSIPTVIYGRNFIKRSLHKREWLVVPFLSGEERLEIHICMAPDPAPPMERIRPGSSKPLGLHV
ncbi:MAG: chemotaxis protein CheX [Acidobacteria bacterium]|nr:chemotaxis protein CheX [Acidobacteriota bacterium]